MWQCPMHIMLFRTARFLVWLLKGTHHRCHRRTWPCQSFVRDALREVDRARDEQSSGVVAFFDSEFVATVKDHRHARTVGRLLPVGRRLAMPVSGARRVCLVWRCPGRRLIPRPRHDPGCRGERKHERRLEGGDPWRQRWRKCRS